MAVQFRRPGRLEDEEEAEEEHEERDEVEEGEKESELWRHRGSLLQAEALRQAEEKWHSDAIWRQRLNFSKGLAGRGKKYSPHSTFD